MAKDLRDHRHDRRAHVAAILAAAGFDPDELSATGNHHWPDSATTAGDVMTRPAPIRQPAEQTTGAGAPSAPLLYWVSDVTGPLSLSRTVVFDPIRTGRLHRSNRDGSASSPHPRIANT
jgi:hypothetical protein